MTRAIPAITCPYCEQPAKLVRGNVIYPHRPDLSGLFFWDCEPCDAFVGTHKNSKRHAPLGRLANKDLRKAKIKAHAAFDPVWKEYGISRPEAYRWLASELQIHPINCHIGSFDIQQCLETVVACKARFIRAKFS